MLVLRELWWFSLHISVVASVVVLAVDFPFALAGFPLVPLGFWSGLASMLFLIGMAAHWLYANHCVLTQKQNAVRVRRGKKPLARFVPSFISPYIVYGATAFAVARAVIALI